MRHALRNVLTSHRSPWLATLSAVVTLMMSLAPIQPASAAFPQRPITLVVGFSPGGGGDLYGRLIATALSKTLGQTVVVENRPGAGGSIAAGLVAKAPADGYTILLAMTGNMGVSPAFRPQTLSYKVPDDFAAIGLILEGSTGMFVAPNSPFTSARDLFAHAKQSELTFASTGTGSAVHIAAEYIKAAAGLQMLHIPYRGAGPAITDMIGGQIDLLFTSTSPQVALVRQGGLRLLAVSSAERSPGLPDVPTFKELGIDMTMTQWYGLVAPAGTPQDVLQVLSHHVSLALKDPEVRDFIRRDAAMERDLPLDQFRDYIVRDIARYQAIATPELLAQFK